MNRRTFLASASGGLLAGCTTGEESSETPTGGTASDPPVVPDPSDDQPVVGFETAPLTATVPGWWFRTDDRIFGAPDLVEPATPDSPARLVLSLQNSEEFERTIRARWLPGFGDPPSAESDAGGTLYLAPTANHEVATHAPEYERDDDGRWRLDRLATGYDWFPETVTLGPDERIVGEYHLLGNYDEEAPPVTAGRYRFSSRDARFEVVAWPTDAPGPDADSRFAGKTLPDLPDEDGPTAWYHDADLKTEQFLEPSAERVDAPAKIEFGLVNHAHESMGGNPSYWRLYKLVDGTWYPVAPWGWNLPAARIPPGGVDESVLFLYHGEALDHEVGRTVGNLGGGRYAYTVDYSAGSESHAAAVDLDAPELTVGPEDDAEVVEDGKTVVVRLPNFEDARRPATLTVRRVETADDRLIPEQLPRGSFRALRNTVSLFEPGVETVRLETDRGTALAVVDDGGTRRFEYESDAFEAIGELVEE